MTEREYIEQIRPHLTFDSLSMTAETLMLVTEAVRNFPGSAALWLMHGHAVARAAEDDVADTAIRSFEMCIALQPDNADAYEFLGHYYDGLRRNPEKATELYLRADEVRGRETWLTA